MKGVSRVLTSCASCTKTRHAVAELLVCASKSFLSITEASVIVSGKVPVADATLIKTDY